MDVRSFAARLGDRTGRWLARRFGVDPRALAALRMSLGLLFLADLALRSRDLVAFYTDAGVLPRSVLREEFGGIAALSIHAPEKERQGIERPVSRDESPTSRRPRYWCRSCWSTPRTRCTSSAGTCG